MKFRISPTWRALRIVQPMLLRFRIVMAARAFEIRSLALAHCVNVYRVFLPAADSSGPVSAEHPYSRPRWPGSTWQFLHPRPSHLLRCTTIGAAAAMPAAKSIVAVIIRFFMAISLYEYVGAQVRPDHFCQ